MGETTRPDPPLNDLAHYMKRVHDLSAGLRECEAELVAARQRADHLESVLRDVWECRDALVDLLIEAGALDEIGSIECPGCRGDCVVAYGTEDEALCSTCDGRGSVRALRRVSGGTP
jgi:hypothetical protein